MRLPALSAGPERMARTPVVIDGGVSPQFCSPCVFGHRVCCSIFPPGCHVETCDGGGPICTPCIPFIHKKYCVPGGWQDC
jgi:hypothetical protein